MTNRNKTRTLAILLPSVVLSLAFSACGDDDDDDAAAPTTTMSAASYVDSGNAICDEMIEAIPAALPDLEGPPTVPVIMEMAVDLEPVLQRWRNEVAALTPPADLESQHTELLDALDESIAFTHAAATTEDGAQAAIENGPPLDEPAIAANALFPRCPTGDEG